MLVQLLAHSVVTYISGGGVGEEEIWQEKAYCGQQVQPEVLLVYRERRHW